MLVLRIVAILAVIAIALGFVAFLVSGDRRYLRFSWMVLRYSVIVGLILFVLLGLERLLVAPL
jgi:hypothetical protein